MATTTAVEIIERAGTLIQDTGYVRWTKRELLGYLNDAQKQIAIHRPDASTVNESFATALGTKQTIPAAGLRLIDVVRNVGGRVITQVSRKVLDEQLPDWHETPAIGALDAEHFTYDPRDPKTFYLYPKIQAGRNIEIIYSVSPAVITSTTAQSDPNDLSDISATTISVDDIYFNPILDFVLYRAYAKDTEYAGNTQRAGMHLQSFGNALGVKMQMDTSASPTPKNPDANSGRS